MSFVHRHPSEIPNDALRKSLSLPKGLFFQIGEEYRHDIRMSRNADVFVHIFCQPILCDALSFWNPKYIADVNGD
jgi:hypothetical protein